MAASDEDPRRRELEQRVGHPGRQWDELKDQIQVGAIRNFRSIEAAWLRLMWTLDAYRIAGVPPRHMGKASVAPQPRLAAVYRMKGNWFAEMVALLLQNRTNQPIRPRTNVRGFSQFHQIDVAWPARETDPLVCVETKVTGAPPFGQTRARGRLNDFANRRKELKFAATDLKLFRRAQDTEIRHWGVWRSTAPPQTYFLWAARLSGGQRPEDIGKLVQEAQALIDTYLEGVGIVAWKESRQGESYEAVSLPERARVSDMDDVLYRIESQIRSLAPRGVAPDPVAPHHPAVDVIKLQPDERA